MSDPLGQSPPASGAPPDGVLLRHDGPVTQDRVVTHGQALRALPGFSDNARHRLFATFVELAQNIARYSAERAGPPGEERGCGEILVSTAPGGCLVSAANLVPPAAAAALAAQLAGLAGLDAEGLKKLHRERRRSAPPPGSLGAGLGLIELARHASAALSHTAEPAPGGLVRFALVVPLSAA